VALVEEYIAGSEEAFPQFSFIVKVDEKCGMRTQRLLRSADLQASSVIRARFF
jgi:hypothetical protein